MKQLKTDYGTVRIGSRVNLFSRLIDIMETTAASCGDPFTIGLTGGSTPHAFYEWARTQYALTPAIIRQAVWCVSDERFVPLTSQESNFGNADRELLEPFNVPPERKCPWPTQVDPHSAALVFERRMRDRYSTERAFDLCLLGMGDDGHTASIFPDSPLLAIGAAQYFAPVEVPGKGWRLSITPDGLRACGKVVVMVTGKGKASMVGKVFKGPDNRYPVQLLKACAKRVEWLMDPEAAGELQGS